MCPPLKRRGRRIQYSISLYSFLLSMPWLLLFLLLCCSSSTNQHRWEIAAAAFVVVVVGPSHHRSLLYQDSVSVMMDSNKRWRKNPLYHGRRILNKSPQPPHPMQRQRQQEQRFESFSTTTTTTCRRAAVTLPMFRVYHTNLPSPKTPTSSSPSAPSFTSSSSSSEPSMSSSTSSSSSSSDKESSSPSLNSTLPPRNETADTPLVVVVDDDTRYGAANWTRPPENSSNTSTTTNSSATGSSSVDDIIRNSKAMTTTTTTTATNNNITSSNLLNATKKQRTAAALSSSSSTLTSASSRSFAENLIHQWTSSPYSSSSPPPAAAEYSFLSTFQNNNNGKPKSSTNNNNNSNVVVGERGESIIVTTSAATTANAAPLNLTGLRPSDLVTVMDLEQILRANGYVRQSDLATSAADTTAAATIAARGGGGTAARSSGSSSSSSKMYNANNINDIMTNTVEGIGKPVTKQQHAAKEILATTTNKAQTAAGDKSSSSSSSSSNSYNNVAFPQPSVLSYDSLLWGTTASATLCGLIVGYSVLSNLWLLGAVAGGFYGYTIAKELPSRALLPTSVVPAMLVRCGRKVALLCLQAYDYCNVLFFMWKTGQLSYGYYKQYASLDQRFAIQEKIDAWNAKFVQGKVNFDKWEKEHEVGRKVLAAMRTAWLVEERSFKKSLTKKSTSVVGRRTSRYRIIQFVYDAAFWSGRLLASVWRTLLRRGRSSNDGGKDDNNNSMSLSRQVREFMKGISMDISESRLNDIGARIGAVFAALIAVNITGALFAISPLFLACFAIVLGVAWPTWLAEFVQRMQEFLLETRARGRGDSSYGGVGSGNKLLLSPMSRGSRQRRDPPPRRPLRTRYDRSRFHYYIQADGQRRWYRTGQSWLGVKSSTNIKKKEDPSKKWPWQQSSSSSSSQSKQSWKFF